jgi:signal transduction histidine kinase
VRQSGEALPKFPHRWYGPPYDGLMVIAALALLAGLAEGLLVLTSDHFTDRAWALFGPVVGWSFIGTGMYARRRYPGSRFGVLMITLGFTWFLAGLAAADAPLVFTLGIMLGSLWGAVLAHVLLSFPSGHLSSGPQRALVLCGYVLVPLAPVPAMLVSDADAIAGCGDRCPANLLLVESDEQLSGVLLTAGAAVIMTLCLLVVGFLAARWRAAGASERRSLAPLFGAGAGTLLLIFAYAATDAPPLRTLAFVAFALTPLAFLAGLARADVAAARGLRGLVARLGDLPAPRDLRDALASALGDPALSLAYWVPEQAGYVDADGRAVDLPPAGRQATEITRDGRPIAAIVHDPGEDRETVRAAGAATALLLENQRLDAEVRAHMRELKASRERIVEAADAERRRIERDLHDGAQSRLVALALSLRLGRGRLPDGSDAALLVDASIDELKLSLDELRELARGIHPAVLTDRGLEPAVRSLAARSPVPVEIVGASGGRLPAAVETAAYFVVSEALTNVAKYAQAAHASVRLERTGGRLLVEVADDGIGGAAPATGSGLRGLADRVAALDGVLEVVSPPGGGTRLTVELPCA